MSKRTINTKSTTVWKDKQSQYFNSYQPHLAPVVNNYTLKLTSRLATKINLNSKDKLLEIGCGSGRFTLPLLNRGLSITGIDFAQELTNQLKGYQDPNVEVIQGDIDQISTLTKRRFNKIIGFFILHHLDHLTQSLSHLKKVAAPNTQVAFVEPNPLYPLYYIQPFISKNMSWSEEKGFRNMTFTKLQRDFTRAGYRNFQIENFGFFPPFVVNKKLGLALDNFLERQKLLTAVLPFHLITARIN